MVKLECDHCGAHYQRYPSQVTRFCSKRCATAWQRANAFEPLARICAQCGRSFEIPRHRLNANGKQGTYCGIACYNAARAQDETQYGIGRNSKVKTGAFSKVGYAECPECHTVHTIHGKRLGRFTQGHAPACSEECAKARRRVTNNESWKRRYETYHKPYARIRTARRRAEKLTNGPYEDIDLAVLIDRDNRTCHICGEPVDLNARHPHPQSPSMDHVIPLSRGGAHNYQNVSLAHLGCNMRKHNKVA